MNVDWEEIRDVVIGMLVWKRRTRNAQAETREYRSCRARAVMAQVMSASSAPGGRV